MNTPIERVTNNNIFQRIWQFLTDVLGFDKRSLAIFRMFVGIVIFCDIRNRMGDLHAHYTDAGIYSRQDIIAHHSSNDFFVIHLMNGSFSFQFILFSFHLFCALMFIIGYYTWIFNFLTWFLLISLQAYSPFVGHGGDVYARLTLFYALFLPVSEVWSVDAAIKRWKKQGPSSVKKSRRVDYSYFSIASIAVLVQLHCIYWGSVTFKTGAEWQKDGTATFYALQLDFFRLPMGTFLLSLPFWVTKYLTFATLFWEHFGSCFFTIPFKTGYFRILAILGFWAMHIGFGLCLKVGLFAWIAIALVTIATPPMVWDKWLFPWLRTKERMNLTVYFDYSSRFSRFLGFMFKELLFLEETSVHPIQMRESLDSENDDISSDTISTNIIPHTINSGIISANLGKSLGDDFVIDVEKNTTSSSLPTTSSYKINYWLIATDGKREYHNIEALLICFRAAPLLVFFGYLLGKCPQRFIKFLDEWFSTIHIMMTDNLQLSPQQLRTPARGLVHPLREKMRQCKLCTNFYKKFLTQSLILLMLYLILTWNLSNAGIKGYGPPKGLMELMWLTRTDQNWNMFSPHPPKASWWYTIEAERVNTKKFELFHNGGLFTWEGSDIINDDPPPDWGKAFGNHRWFKFFENGFNQNHEHLRLSFGRYVCREYNARHSGGEQLFTFQIYLVSHTTQLDGTKVKNGRTKFWDHKCFDVRPPAH